MDPRVIALCEAVRNAGGRALLVGGWVRDLLLGIESKDFDLEVYRITPERLRSILQGLGRVNTVGESFTVYKLVLNGGNRIEIDVSIPRRESKSGRGHRAFIVEGDPSMTFDEAARRRDFTVNAVMFDPLTTEIIDPYNGAGDLEQRLLRVVAADTFVEDSLRVLRAMQLAARFEMRIDPDTVQLCRGIDLSDLPRERIWGELEKLLTLAERPSIGLRAGLQLGVLHKLFPQLGALVDCRQDPGEHPEGDVFTHTLICVDEAAQLASDLPKPRRLTLLLAALCHDLGKPPTTVVLDGKIIAPGHDVAGVEPARAVLDTLGVHRNDGYDVRSEMLRLVKAHLEPSQLYKQRETVSDGTMRRLALAVDIDLLFRLSKADGNARGSASSSTAADWFMCRARELGIEHGPPDPLLLGRHLIEIGLSPGPELGRLLERVYQLQLDGTFTTFDEALEAARRLNRKTE